MSKEYSGDELVSDGWSHVTLRHNAYATKYFDVDTDMSEIQDFIGHEVPGFELVELPEHRDFAYALEETVKLNKDDD